MQKNDIVAAAFEAWGRDAYKKMSLSDVARELGVTKPALYRHFLCKDALLQAMRADFFDRYVEFLRSIGPELLLADETERLTAVGGALAEHYARRKNDLLFAFAFLLGEKEPDRLFFNEVAARGLPAGLLAAIDPDRGGDRIRVQFAMGTGFFSVVAFHALRKGEPAPDETLVAAAGSAARELISRGLRLDPAEAAGIDYPKLEAMARARAEETADGDGLLPAVASAVAEAGPWNASMELVARRSGLSKSGLYSHFKSREEMLRRLFSVEFDRIATLMEDRVGKGRTDAERIFLAMASAASYLSERPDVLLALDWIRVQRIDLGVIMPPRLVALFAFLETGAGFGGYQADRRELASRWILFHVVNLLMRTKNGDSNEPVQARLRELHSCVCAGLEGR